MDSFWFMVGGLLPTFLVSRLWLWITRSWKDGRYTRLFVCHAGSLTVAGLIAGMGLADGGAFAGVAAIGLYFLPQLVWLLVDVWRLNRPIDNSTRTPFGR